MEPSKAPESFLKPYNPAEREPEMLALWEKSGYANPDNLQTIRQPAEPYSIVLPPPNVTGTLHMGHAAMLAIEDILIRYHRMRGYKTLWVPGTDSAAIATQARVEKDIQKAEGKSRHDLGREELLRRIDAFTEQSKATIINQTKKMGASLDWSRYAYTMDEKRYAAVMEAFIRMYNAELIYRGNRIVNWDPKGQTTISDDEIVYEERDAKLVTFRYSKDFPIPVATTRLETKVGDAAVAVHPDDERYKKYIGKEYDAVFCDVPIHVRVVADQSVDPAFGTGALGVTPAHSTTDWEIGDRHGITNRPQVINEFAKMNVEGRLKGKKTTEAREIILEWLKAEGLFVKEEVIKQNVSTAERTGGIIEPLPKLQWFIDVNKPIKDRGNKSLKEIMREAVSSGEIKILPERFEKIYYHWIDNLRDWCISRQIWFGHRIPAWFKRELGGPHQAKHFNREVLWEKLNIANDVEWRTATDEWQPLPDLPDYVQFGGSPNIQIGERLLKMLKDRGLLDDQWVKSNEIIQPVYKAEEVYVGAKPPDGPGWEQDPDTLDTWFSSGLWTFSTLGWPNETEDLKTYHPTSVLETGYDILFFWVARMILMSGFLLGQVPFRQVYLHGLVRDGQGRKMSKSLGNIIDPLVMIEKYGADAARLSLIIGASMGNDVKLSEDRVRGYKHFANKIWNIARFVLENPSSGGNISGDDQKLVAEAEKIAAEVSDNIDKFRLDLAADSIYHFVWDRFAAEILEDSKPIFKQGGGVAASRAAALYKILTISLKLLHPFMPFVTEAIWQQLPQKDAEVLMVAPWPIGTSEERK